MLTRGIARVTILWVPAAINLLSKSPDPPGREVKFSKGYRSFIGIDGFDLVAAFPCPKKLNLFIIDIIGLYIPQKVKGCLPRS